MVILADLHIHSDNSPDGENSVIELCESAVTKKLKAVAVTDHCELDLYEKDNYDLALRQSHFDTRKAQTVFEGQLEVLSGVELGNALCDISKAEEVTARFTYDFVLGSLHHPQGVDDFAFLDYKTIDVRALLGEYYAEMERMTDWGGFDVLAHLTYPFRYINGIHQMGIDPADYTPQIETILKKAVGRNIGVEINTSGLRQSYGLTLPGLDCLKLYRSLGGEIVTLGSDAHTSRDVGANLTDALSLASEAGFRYFCIFRQRKPVFLPIV